MRKREREREREREGTTQRETHMYTNTHTVHKRKNAEEWNRAKDNAKWLLHIPNWPHGMGLGWTFMMDGSMDNGWINQLSMYGSIDRMKY